MTAITDLRRIPCAGRLAALLAAAALFGLPADACGLAVGHRQLTFTDVSRSGRSVQTEVYYPADAAGDGVAVAAGAYPVVAFGHGYLMPWSVYAWLWEALVPAGHVVALPRTEGGLLPSHAEFGRDLAFVVSALRAAGADPGSPFFGHVGTTAAVMGHSMGGGASVLAAAGDPGITAVANLAAAETNPSAVAAAADVAAPALVFAGSADCVAPPEDHQLPIYGALASGCRTFIGVTGGSHCQFAAANTACSLGETGCPPAGTTRAEQQATVIRHLQPWLAAVLGGDAAAWTEFQARRVSDPAITSLQSCPATAVGDAPLGDRDGLLSCEPNPARASVRFTVRPAGPGPLRLEVFDAAGRRVRTLLDGGGGTDGRVVAWDGTAADGTPAPAGVYTVRASDAGRARQRTFVLLR